MKNLTTVLLFSLIVAIPSSVYATHESEETLAKRTAPVGKVYRAGDEIKKPVVADSPSAPRSGDTIYNSSCMTCHDTGAANAPVVGNKEAWAARISKGQDELVANAINGFNTMPAKGLCMDCSDDELKATVEYMLSKSQ